MDNLIDLNSNVDPAGGISLDTGNLGLVTPNQVDPMIAKERAFKASYGLAGTPAAIPEPDALTGIQNGQEDAMRTSTASTLNNDQAQKRTALISQALAAKQGPLTDEDMAYIQGSPKFNTYFDPKTVWETNFANNYVSELDNFAQKLGDDNFWVQAKDAYPDDMQVAKQYGSVAVAQYQFARNLAQNLQGTIDKQSWPGYLADAAKISFPVLNPYYEAKMRGNVQGVGVLDQGLLGENLELQRQRLLSLPFNEYAEQLTDIVNNLARDNPQVALAFLGTMMGQSGGDRLLNNLNTIGTLSDVGALAAGAKAGFNALRGSFVKKAIVDTVLGSQAPGLTKTGVLSAVGDIGGAAKEAAAQRIIAEMQGVQPNAIDQLTRFLKQDAENIRTNPGSLSDTQRDMLLEQFKASEKNFLTAVADTVKTERVPVEDATRQQLDLMKTAVIKDRYPSVNFVDIADPVRDPLSNTYKVTGLIGREGADAFPNKGLAQIYANQKGLPNATPVQQGLSWFLQVEANFDETNRVVRDFLVSTERPSSQMPVNFVNGIPIVGKLRTAEDTMSLEQRTARKAPVYGQSRIQAAAHQENQYIQQLASKKFNKQQWKDFRSVLEYSQNAKDPKTGERGWTFRNQRELEDHYLRNFDRSPSFEESQAYWANVRLVEFDRMTREISMYRNQARLGAMLHQVGVVNDAGDMVKSPKFVGIREARIKGGKDSWLMLGDKMGDEQVISREFMTRAMQDQINDEIKQGKRSLIRVYDPEARPFKGVFKGGENRIRYVLTKNLDTTPLEYNQIPRRGGGHFDYEYGHYLKQAKISREIIGGVTKEYYEGDRTIAAVERKAVGEQTARDMNTARQLLLEGKEDAARDFVLKSKTIPFEWSEFKAKFKDNTINGQFYPATWNIKEPFTVVAKNRTIGDMSNDLRDRYGLNFRDGTREGSDARNFQVAYTGHRDAEDLYAIDNKGTKANPDFNLQPARLVDPIETMNRSLQSIIRSTLLDDYKISAIETWVRQAERYFKNPKMLRAAPYYYFKTADKNSFLLDADKNAVNTLLANKFKIEQLVGTPSELDTWLHTTASYLADAAYNEGFTTVRGTIGKIVPTWLLPKLTDPFTFLRSVTFNAYLGLFAIPQIIVQSMSIAMIHAISPQHALTGTTGLVLHQLTRINKNPSILAHLDGIASKMGFKPGEFTEAMNALDRTGFAHVAGEYGPLNTLRAPKVIQSGFDKFLSAGQIPFREGERNTRLAAWYTSYREFRAENPTGALSNADLNKILNRADDLYGNMSSASNSILHTGILSLPAQFYAYNIRLAELFLSKRISNAARIRMLAYNGLLYGVPGAWGVSGLPLGDYFRSNALDNGYTPGKNTMDTLWYEGIPAVLLHLMTGHWYNFGPRYGNQGFTQIRNALASDSKWWQLLGGASASFWGNSLGNTSGFLRSTISMMTGNYDKNPMKVEDFLDMFKELQIVFKGYQLYTALHTGMWISKNADYVEGDVSKADAIGMFLSGLQHQDVIDNHTKADIVKDRNYVQSKALKQFEINYNRSIIAQKNDDHQQADQFRKKATFAAISGGLSPDQMGTVVGKANKDYWPLISRTNYDFYLQKNPGLSPGILGTIGTPIGNTNTKAKEDTMRDTYKFIQQQKQQGQP